MMEKGGQLKEMVALVTGGTWGIGVAIAKELYGLGATVIITGTKHDYIPLDCYQYIHTDFSDKKSINKFADQVLDKSIDILINNAGVNKIGPISELSLDDFELVQRVNVIAPFIICQRFWGDKMYIPKLYLI